MKTNNKKVAMITGITGQDGSYLAELLLNKGYRVIGLKRRSSLINTERVDHLYNNPDFKLEYFDLNDVSSMYRWINLYKPDEFYNLAAQSHVRVSFDVSEDTVNGIAMGTLRLLNVIKDISPDTRYYQASSSEMFGDNPVLPLNEDSKLCPASPYACAKVFGHHIVNNYRKAYQLHASSGILMNHESPRRGETFVTRKISMAAANIKLGRQKKIYLGNLDAKRDWAYAGDMVIAMFLMLQQDYPDDYVISTGESRSVREFLQITFDYAGLGDCNKYLEIDPRLYRPHEVPHLLGDSSKAKKILGWEPKVKFEQLVKMMFDADYQKLKGDK